MTHPFDIVAYLKGEQSFLRATLVVLIGNTLAAVTFIGLVFRVLSTNPNLPFALTSGEIIGYVATVCLGDNNDKAKPAERRRLKATECRSKGPD